MPLLSLPSVQQSADHDCGRAVFRCFAEYWGVGSRVPPYPHPLNGTHPDHLEPAFKGAKFRVLAGDMDVPMLAALTRIGRPVACLIRAYGTGHWVAVRGVSRGRVHFMDPADGKNRSWPVAEWAANWHDSDKRGTVFEGYGVAVWV